MPEGGIEGEEDFQSAFTAKAPTSKDGRSLKDFQLHTRLFKHRCSFMIHSLTFRHLTPTLKTTVIKILSDVLTGKDTSGTFDYLGESERTHILDILRDTGVLPKA